MPGYKKYFKILEKNHIKNCVVTIDNAKISMHIFGRDPVSIKVKPTRKRPKAIRATPLVEIPETILDLHPSLVLSMDYMYVQGIPILHSISSGYKFRTIEATRDTSNPNKSNTIKPKINKT